MRVFRWLVTVLAAVVTLPLIALLADAGASWFFPIIAALAGMQILFFCGAGTRRLSEPVPRLRLLCPVSVAALPLAVITTCVWYLGWQRSHPRDAMLPLELLWRGAVAWSLWGAVLFGICHGRRRHRVLGGLALAMLAGGLVGTAVGFALAASGGEWGSRAYDLGMAGICLGLLGIYVTVWGLWACVVVLFLRNRLKQERAEEKTEQPALPS